MVAVSGVSDEEEPAEICVIAGSEYEGILRGVEDGEVERIELEGDGFRFTRSQGDAIPCNEAPEGGFACSGGQYCVDLGDLGSGAVAAVADGEGDFVLRGLQAGEIKRGVGEAEAEREERCLRAATRTICNRHGHLLWR